jgi:ParB-like chromosome segregation protein Spo0J
METLPENHAEKEGTMGNLSLMAFPIVEEAKGLCERIAQLPEDERITVLNEIRWMLHGVSPFRDEPVDCVLWVKGDTVDPNEYNPNVVAPPEMKLLKRSILEDGYTQPVVTWVENGMREVVDGEHRKRVGKEDRQVRERVRGYLPVTTVNEWRHDLGDRMAATIRHNRARGKHVIEGMSDIVVELSRRKWSDERIARELGMEPDEVLRLKQISGLEEMFADAEFSEAWEIVEEENDGTLL